MHEIDDEFRALRGVGLNRMRAVEHMGFHSRQVLQPGEDFGAVEETVVPSRSISTSEMNPGEQRAAGALPDRDSR